MLAQSVPDGSPTMLRCKDVDLIRIPHPASRIPNHLTGLDFADLDFELCSLHPELDRLAKHLLRPLRPIQPHRLGARLQPERPDQPDHPKKMIGMKMREEDLGQRKAHPVAHHLALGALTALEQQSLPFADEGDTGDIPFYGGPGSTGA